MCKFSTIGLDYQDGQAIWIRAFQEGPGSYSWSYIYNMTQATNAQIEAIVDPNSTYGAVFQEILQTVSQSVGCPTPICTSTDLAQVQWAASEVTLNLPLDYFDNANWSIVGYIDTAFNGISPELPVYGRSIVG